METFKQMLMLWRAEFPQEFARFKQMVIQAGGLMPWGRANPQLANQVLSGLADRYADQVEDEEPPAIVRVPTTKREILDRLLENRADDDSQPIRPIRFNQ